jgi:maleylpyruvate isomerase
VTKDVDRAPELAALAAARTARLVQMLRELDGDRLRAPSDLEGWSRLTIVCHLRYGASALLRMTRDVLAGRATAYYPDGRATQRPGTLEPHLGEAAAEVIDSLASVATELDAEWARLGAGGWSLDVVEPPENRDLGTVPLGRLALSRLLEVDVHGTDLAIGFPDWSNPLVEVALPTRLGWLATRRTNHREFDRSLRGSWMLIASDGPSWFVAVDGERAESRPAAEGDEPTATIEGSSRDLLALLLGRTPPRRLSIGGDAAFGLAFSKAFPGP